MYGVYRGGMSQPQSSDPVLYRTRVTNRGGVQGTVTADDGLSLRTGPPERTSSGANPEQLLGMAWSTCLAATLEAVLSDQGLDPAQHRPEVCVEVELHRNPDGSYRFEPTAVVAIPGLPNQEVRELTARAHQRCPVSRLLTAQDAVRVPAVESGT